jgi:hypothetical protein
VATDPPDGSLLDWRDIEHAHPWQTLLLGNGLSINIWPSFAYGSLFDHARGGGLSDVDCALFDGTMNFEAVLGDLRTAIRIGDIIGAPTTAFEQRYRNIQLALGHAVREVHVARAQVPDATLARVRSVLEAFEWVFSTSYDLLLYWSMALGGRFEPFMDHFRGSPCVFRPSVINVPAGKVPVYFLHGALHLVVGTTGMTRKLTANIVRTLLAQFGQPIPGDPGARPLLVTEGSSRDKLRAIEGNAYLSHALDRLRERAEPTVVFGSSLSEQDRHLADALSENPHKPVAVSMTRAPRHELAAKQIEIYGRLKVDSLLFFDSTTHPLVAPTLNAAIR